MGRSWCTAGGPRADVGLAPGAPGGSRHACPGADLGITASSGFRPTAGTRPELGSAGARCTAASATSASPCARVGWSSRAPTVRVPARPAAAPGAGRASTG